MATYGVLSAGTKKYHPNIKFQLAVYPVIGVPFGVWLSPSDIIIGKEARMGTIVNVAQPDSPQRQTKGGVTSIPKEWLKEIISTPISASRSKTYGIINPQSKTYKVIRDIPTIMTGGDWNSGLTIKAGDFVNGIIARNMPNEPKQSLFFNERVASGGIVNFSPPVEYFNVTMAMAKKSHSDTGDATAAEQPAHFFGTVLGIAGGIYGLFYAYKQKCGPVGFVGYYLLFSLIGTYGGFVIDAIVPPLKKSK